MTWFQRNRGRMLVAGLFLLAFGLFQARLKATSERSWFDRTLVAVSAPVQDAVVWLVDGSVETWREYVWLVGVEQDNARLRTRVAELERQLSGQAELRAENERLRGLVGMAQRLHGRKLVAAKVIGLGTSPATQVVRIDVGADDGVAAGDVVLAGTGLVGRVSGATGSYAEVQLLIDPRSAVDVVDRRSRARGMVRGQGAGVPCLVDHLVRTADVIEGDELVTSGIGGLFPSGLPVGRVVSVTSPKVGVFRSAELSPRVDFSVLEELLVVKLSKADEPAPGPEPAEPDDRELDDGAPDDGAPDDGVPDDGAPDDGAPDDGVPDDGEPVP